MPNIPSAAGKLQGFPQKLFSHGGRPLRSWCVMFCDQCTSCLNSSQSLNMWQVGHVFLIFMNINVSLAVPSTRTATAQMDSIKIQQQLARPSFYGSLDLSELNETGHSLAESEFGLSGTGKGCAGFIARIVRSQNRN